MTLDSTAFGYELGQIPRMDTYIFKADQQLIDIACDVAEKEFGKSKVCVGRIVSGDEFVASVERIKMVKRYI